MPSMSTALANPLRSRLISTSSPSRIPKSTCSGERRLSSNTAQTATTLESKGADVSTALSKEAPNGKFNGAKRPITTANKSRVIDRPTISHHPHYIAEHLGDPCTLGALDHLLQCGHKVITRHAETCASNCQHSTNSFLNPKSIDRAFVCLACTTQTMKKEHNEKLWSFLDEMDVVAKTTGKCDAAKWIAEKASTVDDAWKEFEIDQMAKEIAKGRFCYAVHVDEDYRDVYAALVAQVEQSVVQGTQLCSSVAECSASERVDKICKSSRIPKKSLPRCITLM